MKLIYLFVLALLFSCGTTETIQKSSIELEIPGLSRGLVHVNSNNCSTFIEVKEAGVEVVLFPINLPTEYNQEGLVIYFDYMLSSKNPTFNCKVDKVVELKSVRLR